MPVTYEHLTERIPNVSAEELLAGFRPSERFGEVSFDSYIPDPNQPSQAEAVQNSKPSAIKSTKEEVLAGSSVNFLAVKRKTPQNPGSI